MANFHVFQHLPNETCGNIERWIRRNGHAVTRTHFDRNEPPSIPRETDVLVIMGGAMNIYQYRDHPWLVPERKLVEQHLARGGKALGICLGAQILADVLGGRVHQNPEREIGWFPITLTAAAADSPLSAFQNGQHVLHWHGDNFDLPRGARLLASSAATPHQAFTFNGGQVLALQFHLEIGPGDISGQIADCRDDLARSGRWIQSEADLLAHSGLFAAESESLMSHVLDAFVNRPAR